MIRAQHVKALRDRHKEDGVAVLIPATGQFLEELELEGLSIVNSGIEPLELEGEFTKKPVLKWIFENRKNRTFNRLETVLWSAEKDGLIQVGVGTLVPDRVAHRAIEFGFEVLEV